MAEHDLTARMAAQMDRHLVFPLLEFLQERQLYGEQILEAKIDLLRKTHMVDYAMDIYKSLHATEDVPADMVARRSEVVARLRTLEEAPDKQYNIHLERYQIGPDQIEALYQYAKFQFECGNYSGAADYLYQYRALCTNSERSLSALWGKLAAEILMQNWDVAQEELNRLKEIIDSKNFSSPINQLHNRIWLMHWSLYIFFNHENGKNGIIDLFFQDRYLNAIQTNAPHLLRYLAAAVVVNKRRRNMLKELIKVIQQEQQCYKDPITEFLECLYVNYDFDGAQQKLIACEQVILNDPFLGKRIEEGNFISVPLRDEFLENARLFIFETYCRIHRCIDIGMLADKMNMTYDEAELWIMNLVKSSKLDAKIDSVSGTLIVTTNQVNVHEKIIESMKNLNMRTYMLAKSLVDPGHAAAQQDTEREDTSASSQGERGFSRKHSVYITVPTAINFLLPRCLLCFLPCPDLPDHDDDDDDDDHHHDDHGMEEVDDSACAFHGHTDEVFAVACSPIDASLVVSGGKDDRGFLWKIGSAEDVQELTGHGDTVCTVAFSSDGKLVACGSMDGQINVWNTATRTLQGTLEGSESGFEWLKWHPRGHLIIAGSEDCNVWMWNADHNAFLSTFAGHSSTVTCGDFTPDGKLICTGSDDASLRIWDPKSAQSRHVVRGHGYHTEGLTCLAITPDSQSIVSGSKDNSVHIVNINSGQVVGSLVGHTNSVECVDISLSYNWVATGSMDQNLIIWDLAHQAIRSTCEHDEGVTCLAWLGSSRYLASGCIDGKVRIWDSLSGELARTFSGHGDVVQSLAVSADGNLIVSVSSDNSARVFDISMFK